jgi:putative PIN family toxin of toxin-antitoxin system
MRVVIDTNVFISAGISKGITHTVFCDILFSHTPIFTQEMMMEYAQVMQRKKFIKYRDQLSVLMETLLELGEVVIPTTRNFFLPDSDDEIFLQAMQGGNGEVLVTGNMKDFQSPEAKKFSIISPNQWEKYVEEKSF